MMSFVLKILAGKPDFSAKYEDIKSTFKDNYTDMVPMWQDNVPDKFIRWHIDEAIEKNYIEFDAESELYKLNLNGKRLLVKKTEDLPLYFAALSPEEAKGVLKFIEACSIQAPKEKLYSVDPLLITYKTLRDAVVKCLKGEPINMDDITKMNCGTHSEGNPHAVDLEEVLTHLEKAGIITSNLKKTDEDALDKFIRERYGQY